MARPIRVRGECPRCGEVVETDAGFDGRGRAKVTWRGPCPADGCEGRIIAKRVPGQTDPGPTEDTSPAKSGKGPRGQMRLEDVRRMQAEAAAAAEREAAQASGRSVAFMGCLSCGVT